MFKFMIVVTWLTYGLLLLDGDGNPAIAWLTAGIALVISGIVIGMVWQGDDSL